MSIHAYDLHARVASYDANMELMHPNRAKMVQVALDVLPHPADASLVAIDLGTGTGYFAREFLQRYPKARVIAVDGAPTILELARERLKRVAERVQFLTGDFRELKSLVPANTRADVVFSSFALHHLTRDEKLTVSRAVHALLKPDGWFLNADIVVAESREVEARIQSLRVEGIVRRAAGAVPHFACAGSTRAFLDNLEREDGDQPQTLAADLDTFRAAGFRGVTTLWMEYREAVCCCFR